MSRLGSNEENRFENSDPVEDARMREGCVVDYSWEDYDLTDWNDTPPHENGEGWDGNGFGN